MKTRISLLRLIIGAGLATWSFVVAAQAPGAGSGEGVKGPGTRVPFVGQSQQPTLTLEQERARDQAMKRANRRGPPLPIGLDSVIAPPAPETKGNSPAKPAGQTRVDEPGAPGTFHYFRTSAQAPYSTGTSTISELHGAASGPVVFTAANWFASYSTNGGSTFTFVNPYTQFPSLDGGFCCDQTVTYDRFRNQFIWQLQYIYSATTTRGSWRTAFANASSVASGGWCYYDWNPGSFGLGTGLWLDYPNVAVSNNFVWYTVNVYNASDAWQRTLIFRIPLGPASTCSGFTYNYFVVSDRFNFTPTQGAFGTMYWASHNSTSSVRIYRWDEGSGTIFWDDVAISAWPRTLPYQCPGPDGQNWCGRGPNDGRIQTGWVAGGVIGFAWNAGQGTGRPFPYIHVARFAEGTRALLSQPIIWHTDFAWAFPALGVNDRGHIAGSAYWGGGSFFPTMVALVSDDFSGTPPPWENYGVVTSAQGATNAWGDWYASRRHGTSGTTWITTGQARLATGPVQAWYVWMGRERDTPPSLAVSPATGISSSGDQGGPFTPNTFTYGLSAVTGSLSYTITGTPSWLTPSASSGIVTASPTNVTFSVNANANNLTPGTYSSTIAFNNASNGLGNTSRTATLVVRVPPPLLSVAPEGLREITGPEGGPFTPTRVRYRLTTDHGTANWKIKNVPDWLTASPRNGTATTTESVVEVEVNRNTRKLARGRYDAVLKFDNLTNPAQPVLRREISLRVTRGSSDQAAATIEEGPQ